jgi:hypothetical protein
VQDFLSELKAHGSADLNMVMASLNDAELCRLTLEHWKENGWVAVARAMPLIALPGRQFSRQLTLAEFCGEQPAQTQPRDETQPAAAGQTEEQQDDDRT